MEKKLFFYSNHREDDLSIGITKKVHAQIKAFERQGFSVIYSAYYKKGIGIFENGKILDYKKTPFFNSTIGHWLRRCNALNFSRNFIKKNQIDTAYLRFHFWDYYSVELLKVLKKRGTNIIVEAHSFPYKVERSSILVLVYFLDDIFAKKVSKYIDVVAAITDVDDNIWNCNTIKIENGVSADTLRVRKVTNSSNECIKLLCVANEQVAHGLSRLICGMNDYYRNEHDRDIILYLVGEYLDSTKQLVKKYGLEKYVKFVGKKSGEELYCYYDMVDLGVGPLATYLINYHKGECLKTKEYYAVGLPYIASAAENAEINQLEGVLVVEENDNAIDIKRVIDFVDSIDKPQELAERLHTYACANYGWDRQISRIIESLEKK